MKNKTTKKAVYDKGQWPDYAFMHLQLAGKFGLPKETMKSELEDILGRITKTDMAKAVYGKSSDLTEFVTEDNYQEFFDEAIKVGVDRKIINGALYQMTRGILAAHDKCGNGLLESEGDLKEISKKYGVSNKSIHSAVYEAYKRKFR